MNLSKLLQKFGSLLVLLFFLTGSVFAGNIYVSNTNGNDVTGDGQDVGTGIPYKTITKALTVASAGDVIYIDADTYGEAAFNVTTEVTFVARSFNGLDVVTITNLVTIAPGAGKTVKLGRTEDASKQFVLNGGITLTDGALDITTANVTVNGTITRTAGTVDEAFTTTNINVTYNGTDDITAGPELPSDLGTGTLTVSITAGKTLTVPNAVTTTGGVTISTGNATFNGALTLSTSNFTNTPAGNTVTLQDVSFTSGIFTNSNSGTVTMNDISFTSGRLLNNGTGSVTVNNMQWTLGANLAASAIDNNNNGTITVNGNVDFAYSGTTGLYTAVIDNNGTGTITLANGFTASGDVAKACQVEILNASTGSIVANGTVYAEKLTNSSTGSITLTGGTATGTVANNNGGTIEMKADFTFAGATLGNGNAGSVIKLNSNTLTLSGAAATLTNTGKIISSTAATVGSAVVKATKDVTITGGELPNLTIAASAGKVTLSGNVDVYGNLTVASPVAGALTDGANTINLYGNFVRTDNTVGNVAATGTLVFKGTVAQTFTPGASLQVNNLTINNTASSNDVVTMTSSVEVKGNLTITAGQLNVADYNVTLTGAGATFANGGNAYSSTGIGYVVFQNADVAGVGTAGAAATISGAGTFGNMLVNLVDPDDYVITGSAAIAMNANVYLYQGALSIADGHTITFSNATVKIVTDAANKAKLNLPVGGTTGATAVATGKVVNLEYTKASTAAAYTAGLEWSAGTAAKIGDVKINSASTITGYTGASTISGTLSVISGATLAQGANTYTLSGASKTHSVIGTVSGGTLEVTGAGSALNGSTTAADAATVNNLTVNLTNATDTFTSNNLQVISGNLTVTKGAATVAMDATHSTLSGNATLTDGTLNLTIAGTTTSVLTGNVVLTAGNFTLTRGGNSTVIGGGVTLTAGTLTLGSDVTVTGATAQVAGNLDLGGHSYTQLGSAATPDYNRTGAGTVTNGTVVFNSSAAAIDVTPGTSLVLPNVSFVGTANSVTFNGAAEIAGDVLFDNAATVATGANTLTLSGNNVTVESDAGAFTGAVELKGSAATVTLKKDYAFPTLTVNSTGTVTVASDNTTARTLTAGTAFTLTKGILAMGINTLDVATAFTYTAGSITQSTGWLKLNVANPSLVATGFAVDNLEVHTTATDFGTSALTVNKNLKFSVNITTSADGKLTFGDGIVIERNGGALNKVPTFGATTNLVYNGNAGITAGNEQPATVNNYTIKQAGTNVTLAADVTVTGTLSIEGTLTQGAKTCTMADGSTLELKVVGTTAIAGKDLTKAGNMDLIYAAAVATSTRELGAITSGSHPTFNGNITVKGNITLDGDLPINGKLLLDGGNVQFGAGSKVTLMGDFEEKGGEWFTTAAGTVVLGGANNTEFKVSTNHTIDANSKIELSKTNANSVVTLKGGNLTFPSAQPLTLTKGVFDTDASSIIILTQSASSGQPVQGFTRTSGVIAGNVRKFIDKTNTVDISKVEFPTGDTDGNYRPASFFFKTAPQSSVNLTVNHETVSPDGSNGIPLNTGSLTVTNYPDFFWYVKSDIALAPSYKYDVEFQAQGYTDYQKDGIQNIRLIRRDSGNVANPWVMQGADNAYDNSTINNSWPVVKVIDATGGITTQGSKFTYSQNNKPPVFDAALTATTINEGDTLSFTYVASDPDLNQTATMSAVTLPVGATFDASTGKFNWITDNYDAGTHTVTIRATDGTENTDTTVTITVNNVNALPQFVNVPSDTTSVPEGSVYTFTFTASDADTNNTGFTYSLLAPADSVKIVDSTGVLTFNPAFGDEGMVVNYTVRVTDGDGGVADTALTFKVVNQNRAPQFATAMADTNVDEAATLTLDFKANASDPDGDPLTFSFTLTKDGSTVADSGAIDASTGIYTWTPKYTQAGVYELVVTATDGVDSAMDTVAVTVNNKNAAPTWVKVLPDTTIFVGDTLNFTYMVDDLDMDAITFMFNGPADARANLDASTGKLTWDPQTENDFISLVKVKATDGIDTIYTQAEVTVKKVTVTISGVVTYENTNNDPIANAKVELMQGSTVVATDSTDATGAYMFDNLSAGEYTVKVSKVDGWPEADVLASDALLAARSSVDTNVTLTAMQTLAADVTGDNVVNSFDALQILQRVVKLTDSFAVADWLFESKTVTVGTKNKVVDLKAIAAGDVNESYSATAPLAKESTVSYVQDEMIQIRPNAEFEIPVKLDAMDNVSAFTMNFSYPADKMELVGVKSAKQVVSNAKDGKLAIAWADLNGKESFEAADDAIIVLKFKATEAFKKSESANVELESAEVVNKLGKDINSSVSTNGVEISIPNKFALNNNYPNPFNPTTTISYDLPVQGKVTLTIFNSLGQEVAKLVNGVQEAGSYKQVWNASNVASGIYFFNITVEGTKNFTQTKKMVLLK